MDKFNFMGFRQYADLPFDDFNEVKFSVYVLDKEWNYLFVNKFVQQNLGAKGEKLKGKNMWTQFPELMFDAVFVLLKTNTEKGVATNTVTTSPVTGQRLNIVGYPLSDCYFFFSSVLPTKDDLIKELRREIEKKKSF